MLAETLLRLDGLVPATRRTVVTQEAHYQRTLEVVRAGESDALATTVIAEPEARGTLAAVSLATLQLRARDPQAVVISLHCDAFIKDVATLQAALTAAIEVARHDYIVLLGAKPCYAATNYDYIRQGALLKNLQVHKAHFCYRPTAPEAAEYVRTGGYYWNSGIFVWRADFFQQQLQATQPQVWQALSTCLSAAGDIDTAQLACCYAQLQETSVDGGLIAHSSSCVVLPLDCGWLDIGSWEALAQVFNTDTHGNLALGQVLLRDCRGTTVKTSAAQVVALGLQNVVVVVTDDAVLVCAQERAQEVRTLVTCLPESLR